MINPLLQALISGVLFAVALFPFATIVHIACELRKQRLTMLTWYTLYGTVLASLAAVIPALAWCTLYNLNYPVWLPGATLTSLAFMLFVYVVMTFQDIINDWPRWLGGNGGLLP